MLGNSRMPEPYRPMVPEGPRPARDVRDALLARIVEYQTSLNEDHEVGAKLASFGQSMVIHISDIGHQGDHLIVVDGFDEQQHAVQLIQHVTQLNVLLVAVPKLADQPRRIGFHE